MDKHKIIIIALAVLLVIVTTLVPPFFGRNDDGGVSGLISENGLSYPGEIQEDSLNHSFAVTDQSEGSFMPVIAAKKMSAMLHSGFDTRMMALVYLALFLIGLCLIISSIDVINKKAQIFVCIFAAIILCDVAYTSYFNSFYYEALYLSALTLLFGSLMFMFGKESNSITAVVIALLAVTVIASSGAFGVAVAMLTAALFFTIGFWDKSKIRKPFTVATALLIVAIALSVLSVAPSIKGGDRDRYNALFCGVLYGSEDVNADLAYFGIPEEYASFADKTYDEAGKEINLENGIVKENLFSKITTSKITSFYLSHPKRLFGVFNKAAKAAPSLSQDYVSTKTDKSFLKTAPALWSTVHRFLMPGSLFVLLALFIVITVLAAISMKKMPFFSKTVIFSVLTACVLLAEPVISGGLANISRRLILFQFAYDMIILMCVNWIINAVTLHRAK
ncbi:MAG: hypothetical protein J5590_07365 [Clostridia bacterium]|nr:hypothetical protein [Clostridia bacterium]